MTDHSTSDRVRQASSFCELFQRTVREHANRVALCTSAGQAITWAEYGDRVRRIAAGLAALGVGRTDTVALMLTNRPEFHLVDAAAMHLGAVPFSVYNTNPVDVITHLLVNAGSRVVVCEEEYLDTVLAARAGTQVEYVICVEGGRADTMTLEELTNSANPGFDFDAAWQVVTREDLLTLIYTSGTTGAPKGVELTHGNVLSNLAAGLAIPVFAEGAREGRVISYLPDAHIVNRWLAHYLPMSSGATVTDVADAKTLLGALVEVRPTLFVAVPMLWYKIIAAASRIPGVHDASAGVVASALGLDQVSMAFSGAAAIAAEALETLLGFGIPCCEAWGMSELSAIGTLNRPEDMRFGTVGRAVDGVELKVADDGELLVRSPGLMRGYRDAPELTREAVDAGGWMHTGDIATIDEDGFVRIVDRKKELIINSAGKNISPTNIENQVKTACSLVGSVVAVGDDRKYITALITLDPDAATALAAALELPDSSPAVMAEHPRVQAVVRAGVHQANANLSRVEQIKTYTLIPDYWAPGGDELTPTMKLKRKPIAEKYQTQIDAMYEVS